MKNNETSQLLSPLVSNGCLLLIWKFYNKPVKSNYASSPISPCISDGLDTFWSLLSYDICSKHTPDVKNNHMHCVWRNVAGKGAVGTIFILTANLFWLYLFLVKNNHMVCPLRVFEGALCTQYCAFAWKQHMEFKNMLIQYTVCFILYLKKKTL